MLGHILRNQENTPAQTTMFFAVDNAFKGRVGRHQMNLLDIIKEDVESKDDKICATVAKNWANYSLPIDSLSFKNCKDLNVLREIAMDRKLWKSCY